MLLFEGGARQSVKNESRKFVSAISGWLTHFAELAGAIWWTEAASIAGRRDKAHTPALAFWADCTIIR